MGSGDNGKKHHLLDALTTVMTSSMVTVAVLLWTVEGVRVVMKGEVMEENGQMEVDRAWASPAIFDVMQCGLGEVFWPANNTCVEEGLQGPCKEGQRVTLNRTTRVPECQCLPRYLAWRDGRCFLRFSQGPCGTGGMITHTDGVDGAASCRCRKDYSRWTDGLCYKDFTPGPCTASDAVYHKGSCVRKGPCPNGFWLQWDAPLNKFTCQCPPGFLRVMAVNRCFRIRISCRECSENLLYWPEGNQYYLEYTQGPCPKGRLLLHTPEGPVCGCRKHNDSNPIMRHHEQTAVWPLDGSCHRLHSQAICRDGEWFVWADYKNKIPVCCPAGHYYWPKHGRCYEELTRGPCEANQLFLHIFHEPKCTCDDQWGFTATNPQDGRCYLRNSQGPCGFGFRFLGAEGNSSICDCLRGWFYWTELKACYPLYTRGPCTPDTWLVYSHETGAPICAPNPCLDVNVTSESRLMFLAATGQCHPLGGRGPCPPHHLLLLDRDGITPQCRTPDKPDQSAAVFAAPVLVCQPGSRRALSGDCVPHTPEKPPSTSGTSDLSDLCLVGDQRCRDLMAKSATSKTTTTTTTATVRKRNNLSLEELTNEFRQDDDPEDDAATCPPGYYPWPDDEGVCMCPQNSHPDPDGECRPVSTILTGPLAWTILNFNHKTKNPLIDL